MKVLQVSNIDMTIYKFVVPLMDELKKEGFEVITACNNTGYAEKIKDKGYKFNPLSIERGLNPLALIKSIKELYVIMKKEQVDIVHVHTPIASVVARIAAKLYGKCEVIYTVHGLIVSNKIFYYIEKYMGRYFTDYVFTVNNEDYKYMIENKFIKKEKIEVINGVGIDENYFNSQAVDLKKTDFYKKEYNIKEKDFIVGFVGRITKEKGVLDLVKAFRYIENRNKNVKLLLVGPWDKGERDSCYKEVLETIEKNNLKNKVILTGLKEDIREHLSLMDVFVLPSYREGMPVSLLEAMSMKRACIATNIRGCREEIDASSGVLYEKGNIEELTSAEQDLIDNNQKRIKFGNEARKRAEKIFSKDKVLEKQLKVYRKIKNREGN